MYLYGLYVKDFMDMVFFENSEEMFCYVKWYGSCVVDIVMKILCGFVYFNFLLCELFVLILEFLLFIVIGKKYYYVYIYYMYEVLDDSLI